MTRPVLVLIGLSLVFAFLTFRHGRGSLPPGTIADSTLGMNVNHLSHANADELVDSLKSAGVGWVRFDFYWYLIEQTPGNKIFYWHWYVPESEDRGILNVDLRNDSAVILGKEAAFDVLVERTDDPQATILGPTEVPPNTYCKFEEDTSDGLRPYSYEWYKDGVVIGTDDYVVIATGDPGSDFDLRLEVRDRDGRAAWDLIEVIVTNEADECPAQDRVEGR